MSKKSEHVKLVRLLGALVPILLILWAGSGAAAQSTRQPTNDRLFEPAAQPRTMQATGATVIQARTVSVNWGALGTPETPAHKVVLNLFPGAVFTAEFERTETNSLGSYAWIGNLEGIKFGQALLVVTNGLLRGHISMPGAIYEVRPVGHGLHAIEQIDQSAFPPEMHPAASQAPRQAAAERSITQDDPCDEMLVLVAYSPEARAADGGTANMEATIALAVVEANQSYVNSDIDQRIHLVHTMETSAGDSVNDFVPDLAALENLADGIFDDVDAAREFHFADMVALIIENPAYCGRAAAIDATAAQAFVTVYRDCATGYYSFVHELGHLSGARHDWYADDTVSAAHGWVYLPDRWRTIMAYNDLCEDSPPGDDCDRLQWWSNPDIDYGGIAMGVPSGTSTACKAGDTTPDPSSCDADNREKLNATCDTVANFRSGNQAPVLTVDNDPLTVDEGSMANNSGTVNDPDGHEVTLTASAGTVVNNDDGTWSWSMGTDDGPADSQIVTISADDGHLGTADITFWLQVENVAPTATFNSPTEVDEGDSFGLSLTGAYDPSGADTAAGFSYDFDCGAGYDGWDTDSTATCQTYDDGLLAVAGKIRDKDGGVTEYTTAVTVNNLPPQVSVDRTEQTIQYSDSFCTVTFTASDVAADPLTATPAAALPDSLALTPQGCVPSVDGIWHTCTWTLDGTLDEPAGDYDITIDVDDGDGGTASATTTVTVEPEDAEIWLEPTNPVAVEVDSPGGDSGLFTLIAYVQETLPDEALCGADPGDINDAQVSVSLVPVGPGSTVTMVCTNAGVSGSGYDAVLTAECDFDNVPVNIYGIQATVVGGYYVSGLAEEVLVVYDPSLGFTTGGGWFTWPGTDDRTSFGYVMKYNKKMKNVRGNLLIMRHQENGSKYRVKSNALQGLAIGDLGGGGDGWASFAGKCTYSEPAWPGVQGNYRFIVYVEDRGEPGAGHDQFWLEISDRDLVPVGEMSMARPGSGNTVTLGGGNIVVPHSADQ